LRLIANRTAICDGRTCGANISMIRAGTRHFLRRHPLVGQRAELGAIGGQQNDAKLGHEHAPTVPARGGEVQ
jgi:hypothetical protein